MSSYELATEAKRAGNFDLALKYYQQIINETGLSANLLQALAETFYLKKQNDFAVAFNLAAAHLQLHIYEQNLQQGNSTVENAIKEVPEDIRKKFPKRVGVFLIYEKNIIRHISHALLDQELVFQKDPDLRRYAHIYRAQVLEDGSASELMEKYDVTSEDVANVDEERYHPHGFRVLMREIKWNQLDNPDVWSLYINAK